MGFLTILIALSISSWLLYATFRRLRRYHANSRWWFAFTAFLLVGAVVGYWLAFRFEYQVSPGTRFCSFPIPVDFFHLEDGQWVDFPTSALFGYPAMITNVVTATAVAVLPVFAVSLCCHRECGEHESAPGPSKTER